jgi:hypothetical protein
MGHLLKIKCVDSRVNVNILDSTSVPFTLMTVQNAKFSTNSHETDYSAWVRVVYLGLLMLTLSGLQLVDLSTILLGLSTMLLDLSTMLLDLSTMLLDLSTRLLDLSTSLPEG